MRSVATNDRGVALLTTLLALVFMVILTLNFGDVIRRNLTGANYGMTRIELAERVRSAVNLALALLYADQQESSSDSLQEPWADGGVLRQLTGQMFDDGTLDLAIEDHGGRLQVNALVTEGGTVDPEQRGRFFRLLTSFEIGLSPDEAEHLLDALTDWLDENDEITGFGAENSWYQTLPSPYACKNGIITSLEELTLVRGFTPALLHGSNKHPGLDQLLTPYGTKGDININTAPPLVLATLAEGLDQATVDALLAYRADKGHDLASPEWYKNVSGDLALTKTTVNSANFCVRVRGSLRNVTIRAQAVVFRGDRSETPNAPPILPDIRSWQEE